MTPTWVGNFVLNACYNSIARDNPFVRRRLSCEINVCQGRSFDKELYIKMPFSDGFVLCIFAKTISIFKIVVYFSVRSCSFYYVVEI